MSPFDDSALPADEQPGTTELPVSSPDLTEEELAGAMDDIIPTRVNHLTPVVGLGGSAGSIQALRTFFEHMPADSGLAFVVVVHLSPEHESSLASLLQNTTRMPVVQATEPVEVEPDHVYVIAPAKSLSMEDGHLRLFDLEPRRGKHVVVDLFFRALADTHGPNSVAIVLSGADGDGAIGLKRMKERGGLTVAQEPGEAEYDGMPRAAVATGMVDWVLPVAEMPTRLVEFHRRRSRLRLPAEHEPPRDTRAEDETSLREVLAFQRARTGRDFAYYKRATVLRRLSRRMQVNGVDDLPSYLDFLRTHPSESTSLLQDLLISVTNFFRDRDSFDALERQIPRLFRDKTASDQVRVWVAGCATGEEAYSVAMLLAEHAAKLDQRPAVQIFATDLDEVSIRSARDGLYPDTISADVSQGRLRAFFNKEPHGYRVRRELRETVLFAPHDLLKDSPFSRVDLVTCRNLLIYLNRDAQNRAFDIFHFALRHAGLLFLGTSESAEGSGQLFSPLDKKHRLYSRRPIARSSPPSLFSGTSLLALSMNAPILSLANPRALLAPAPSPPAAPPSGDRPDLTWSEVHFRLLESFAPPSLIVDSESNIVHLSENAGRFLRFGSGEPSVNLLRSVDPLLRLELRTALFRARQSAETVEIASVPTEMDGQKRLINLRVRPAQDLAPGYLLVVFEEAGAASPDVPTRVKADPLVLDLERELEQIKQQQRESVEQFEASSEELKASNEELQAMNEELRSATEELETSREELQSINEELVTVNHELKGNIDELGRANSDLQNLMASTNIATVFLDRELYIKRFTPSAVTIFNLIPADVGRPLSDLRGTLDYDALAVDAARVLESLTFIEREIRATDGRHFLARLLPYRTTDDHIVGVGLTFIDITARKLAEEGRLESESRLASFVRQATVPVAETDLTGRYTMVNQPYCQLTGRTEAELLGRRYTEISHPDDLPGNVEPFERLVRDGTPFEIEKRYLRPDGSAVWVHNSVSLLRDTDGQPASCVSVTVDINERKLAEAALRRSQSLNRLVLENARQFAIFTLDGNGVVTSWNPGGEALFQWSPEEIVGRGVLELLPPERRSRGVQQHIDIALREGRSEFEDWFLRKDKTRFWSGGILTPMLENGRVVGFLKIMRDLTHEREAQDERARLLAAEQAARREAESANQTKDRFLASLSHELRTPLTPVQLALFGLRREKRLSAAGRDMLAMISRSVETEVRLIDDLLDVSRIVHGKLDLHLEIIDIHTCIQHALEVCRADCEAKHQGLSVTLEAPRQELSGDADRLKQVFWNLFKNAAKFTPEAGRVTVRSYNVGDREIAIEINDNGQGMDALTLEKIFDAFRAGQPGHHPPFRRPGVGAGDLACHRRSPRRQAHGGQPRSRSGLHLHGDSPAPPFVAADRDDHCQYDAAVRHHPVVCPFTTAPGTRCSRKSCPRRPARSAPRATRVPASARAGCLPETPPSPTATNRPRADTPSASFPVVPSRAASGGKSGFPGRNSRPARPPATSRSGHRSRTKTDSSTPNSSPATTPSPRRHSADSGRRCRPRACPRSTSRRVPPRS